MPEMKMVPVDEIRPNPFQPREAFDKEKIKELADSIEEEDLIQPILVRRKGKTYQIIAGDRRWRAFQFLKRKEIPAIEREADDIEARELSLAENWHRLDLKDKEVEDFVCSLYKDGKKSGRYKTQQDIAEKTGIPRTTISRIISSKGEKEGLRISDRAVSRDDMDRTRPLKDEPELRKRVLKLREEGEIKALDLKEFSETVKGCSEPIREALLEGTVSLEEAKMIDAELCRRSEREEVIGELRRERTLDHAEAHVDFVKSREERKEIEAEMVRTATGDIWACPICSKKYRLVHVDPIGSHRFEEIED